jgi:purine-binding chemotaxis protein CheW
LASTETTASVTKIRVLLFGLAEQAYGCDIRTVREIIPLRPATRLPGSPDYVCGLINLRGTIVTVLDLGCRLARTSGSRADGSIILVEVGTKVVGIAVDEVMDVRTLSGDSIEDATAEEKRGGWVRGMGRIDDDRVVILLDMPALATQVLLQ